MGAEFKNKFSWSKSRDGVFKECHRKYYYNHYGFWGGWDATTADKRTRQLYILKNLLNRHMWLGGVVHDSIEEMIRELKSGKNPDVYKHIGSLHRRIEKEFEDSLAGRYKTNPKKVLGLFEHEYEIPITKEEWAEIPVKAERCLTNFFNSDRFQNIQSTKYQDYVLIEKLDTFDFEGATVWVKVDFASKEGDKLVITDWKTGKIRRVEMDTQLACYSLYAQEKMGYAPENILCKRHNVFLDEIDEFEIGPELISEVEAHMRQSIADMKKLLVDVENNTAREEDFQITTDDNICKVCNFRKACSKWA